MLYSILLIIIFLIAILMVLVVLLQSGKGGGLAGVAAGGATTQILGARQAPDVLEKATWTLATAFMVLCVLTNFVIDRGGAGSIIQDTGVPGETEQLPTIPAPGEETEPAPAPLPAPDSE